MSEIATKIRRELQRYIDGEIELHQFEDFFVPLLWDVDSHDDSEASELAGSIHNLTAEYSRRDRSLDSLREELTRIARPFGRVIAFARSTTQAEPYVISEPREVTFGFGAIRKPPQMATVVGDLVPLELVYRG